MNYQEVRSIAKDGDVLFFHVDKRSFLSRLVSWFTQSPHTHVGFLFWFKDRLMLLDSGTKGGPRIILASKYNDNTFDLVPAPRVWSDIEEKALARSGSAHYGWFSAAYIGLREFMFTHFGIRLPANKNNRNKACSEFVAEILELEDVDISPALLYSLLSKK
jgi:hypothetical protein